MKHINPRPGHLGPTFTRALMGLNGPKSQSNLNNPHSALLCPPRTPSAITKAALLWGPGDPIATHKNNNPSWLAWGRAGQGGAGGTDKVRQYSLGSSS